MCATYSQGSLGKTRGLAAVASLLGFGSSGWEQRTREAAGRFRAIPFSVLRPSHFESPEVTPAEQALFASTQRKPALNEVDAFVSHSWSDEPDAKYEALRLWALKFEQAHGRQPLLWLDKACLGRDSDAALAYVPIYVRRPSNRPSTSTISPAMSVGRTRTRIAPRPSLPARGQFRRIGSRPLAFPRTKPPPPPPPSRSRRARAASSLSSPERHTLIAYGASWRSFASLRWAAPSATSSCSMCATRYHPTFQLVRANRQCASVVGVSARSGAVPTALNSSI